MANELWSVVMQCFTTVCQFLWKVQEWTICIVKVDHSQVTQLAITKQKHLFLIETKPIKFRFVATCSLSLTVND